MTRVFDDPEMQEIFDGYLVETQELLEGLTQDLMEMENQPENLDLINQIFRGFHTIKGTSSFMGFSNIADITHHAEDILNKIRRSEMSINFEIVDVLLEVQDWINKLLDKILQGDDSPSDYSATIEKINRIKSGTTIKSAEKNNDDINSAEKIENEEEINTKGSLESVLSNPEIGKGHGDFSEDEYKLIDAAFAEVNENFHKETQSQSSSAQEESIENKKEIPPEEPKTSPNEGVTPKLEKASPTTDNNSSKSASPPIASEQKEINPRKPSLSNETIRIDISRVESLMDLSGELVLGRNRLQQLTERLENQFGGKDLIREVIENTSQIDFVTSEIQSAIMRMRMVPIAKLYQKAPRIVRDLSKEFGKKIKLVLKGEDTEIDRGIIEELNDPLVHMIRNSCDHGIEEMETRSKIGKPPEGTITLDADHEGNNIVLRISDDGKGMDPEKLKEKAIEKGVITPEQASQMGAKEAFQLIFAAGFSTAKKVSAVSGRGVGMDVVRTNIQKLKGMVDIESQLGKGTTFVIKLPLTLAIIQGLLVKVEKETFAIPLSSVIEVISIEDGSISTVNGQEVIRFRDEVLPIITLSQSLNLGYPKKSNLDQYVVSVGIGAHRLGLIVDELLGQQEIVIKSLGDYLGSIKGVAGSTILGDGRVIMIVDIAQVIHKVYDNGYMQFSR